MAEEKRSTGAVTRFFVKKGYGFIKPHADGGEDLFFHFSKIQSDDKFRTLHPDQEVEFIIALDEKKERMVAIEVTPPGGGKFDSSHRKRRNNSRRSKGNGSGGVECNNCGGVGHTERVCPTERPPRFIHRIGCYVCGDSRHLARECPRGERGGGDGRDGCYTCGQKGHFARECLSGNGGRGGKKQETRDCHKCGKIGHIQRDCKEVPQAA